MKFLKNLILTVLLMGAIGLWVYVDANKKGPCDAPIAYTISAPDPRFNISKTDFINTVNQAVDIWEEATGKDLFTYDAVPKKPSEFYQLIGHYFVRDDIKVSLVYDERQEASNLHDTLVTEVSGQKQDAAQIKAQFTALQSQYKEASAEYQSLVSDYKRHKVDYATVEAKRQYVNSLADQINSLVKKYNSIVGDLNQTVNTINQTAGQQFEEGQYVLDQKGERITIYEFSTRRDLLRVLAHEFGHALGMDHNDNPDSIMYYLNDSPNMVPTKDDLSALAAICIKK